jgi:hypothetical protein
VRDLASWKPAPLEPDARTALTQVVRDVWSVTVEAGSADYAFRPPRQFATVYDRGSVPNAKQEDGERHLCV